MSPTCYFRWVHKELGAPCRVLQQWWTVPAFVLESPGFHPGEWRDIEDIGYLAEQPKETTVQIQSIESKVCLVIAQQLGTEASQVLPTTQTDSDLAIDSLDHAELTLALEDEFDIEIPDFDQPATVQGYIDAVQRVRKS